MASGLASRGLPSAAELARKHPHGVRLRYVAGCRCTDCRKANSRYENERQKARRNGDWNGIVPATDARQHILRLRRQGIGRRAIAAASDVPETIICEIVRGKPNIRARTSRKILAVTPAMRSDGALVPAARTWQLINRLIEEEYTVQFLARRLGYANRYLQFGRKRVTARTAYRVERLYRELTT